MNTDREGLFHSLTVVFVFFFDVEGSLSEPLASDCSNCSSSSSLSGFRLGMVRKMCSTRVAFQLSTRHKRVTECVTRQVATPASAVPLQVLCLCLWLQPISDSLYCAHPRYHFQHYTSYTTILHCSHFPWVSPGK